MQVGQAFNQRRDLVRVFPVDQQGLRFGVLQNVGEVRRGEAVVEGRQNGADLRHGKEGFQHAVAVRRQHGDRVPLADAALAQGVGQPVHPFLQLAVRVAVVAVDDGRFVGKEACRPAQELQGQEGLEHVRPVSYSSAGGV